MPPACRRLGRSCEWTSDGGDRLRRLKQRYPARRSGEMGLIPLLAAAVALAPTPDPPAPVRLTYLANEGVVLSSPHGRVFIDAFFGDGLPDYAVVPPPSRDSLERAAGPYGGPVLLLSTHAHRDHYDSAAVARYLASNP